jgi:hypothetical protein
MFLLGKSLTRQHFDTRLASDEPWHNAHNSIDFSHDIRNTITCKVESRLLDRKHHYTACSHDNLRKKLGSGFVLHQSCNLGDVDFNLAR